jgi:hypothetical protein
MNKTSKPHHFISKLSLALLGFLLLTPLSAWAYLDPTTGSMLISAIVGLFASLVLAIKTYWYRIKGFFKRKPDGNQTEDESS